jgi:hypothetical protein
MNNLFMEQRTKTTKTILLTLGLVGASMIGQAGEPFRTDINPALLYYQAFLAAPDPMSSADMDYLYSPAARTQPLPERFGKLFAGYDNQFKLVRQAAQAKVPCDWGIDMSPGPHTLLLPLARAKAVMQAARFRVMWELQQGQQAEARDDLLAAMALGRNLSGDGTLISVLVQIAMEAIASSTVAENFARFSPDTLQQFIQGLDALPARGTVAASMTTEKLFFHDWLVRKVIEIKAESGSDETKAMAGIHKLVVGVEGGDEADKGRSDVWTRVLTGSGGTSDGFLNLLNRQSQMKDRFAAIASLPYAEFETQMAAFTNEVGKTLDPFLFLPALERARAREFRIDATLAMVRAAVEYKLHGDTGLQAVNDPCGQGPFGFERFFFKGVDRGFKLTSAFNMGGTKAVLIFVEGDGPAFRVDGTHVGEPLPEPGAQK